MQIILCDDNPVFLSELERKIRGISARHDWNNQYLLFHTPRVLLDADLSGTDVIFLDIDMPEITGIETARALRTKYPAVLIVFVTGYIQYARDGYQVEAFRYLMKDLLESELSDCLADIQKKLYEDQESITVHMLEYAAPVRLKDILYFEGTGHRHVIMHRNQDIVECHGKLGDYEKQLDQNGFLRIQRSYLVNMQHGF